MARTVTALVLREMSTRYGRSPGGYIWAIIEPLGSILLMSIGFSLLLRSPPVGNSFILFFATGFVPFGFYQAISNAIARALRFSGVLLSYPVVTWVDAIVARLLLNSLTQILVAYIILGAILSTQADPVTLNFGPIAQAMSLSLLFATGVGALNCALMGLIQVWDQIWSIITRPLFLASGVIFMYDSLPDIAQKILWFNPLMHISGIMREGFYPGYDADYVSVPYVIGVSLALLFIGVVLLGRYHRQILSS
jgi:capsular polysaccharide transport system permease protein